MAYIDLTMNLPKENDVWRRLKDKTDNLVNTGHLGTHIDVYNYSSIPWNYINTKAIFLDCTTYGFNEEIGLEIIKDIMIYPQHSIIFKTNFALAYPYGTIEYLKNHPVLSDELIDYLLAKDCLFIGLDTSGIQVSKKHVVVDKLVEDHKSFAIENLDLNNLNFVHGEIFELYTAWIDNPFSTALQARVFAKLD